MSLDQPDNSERIAQIEEQIQAIEAEVDGLRTLVTGADKPWYKQMPTLVAIIALVFSFGTTVVSYQRIAQQDRHAAQVELRTLIQRITALPSENFELLQKYQDQPLQAEALSGYINSENLILAQQAASILEQIPDFASAGEYYAVADGLVSSGITEGAGELYEQAAERATNPTVAVNAYRSLGGLAFSEGRIDAGREYFRMAMDIFTTRFQSAPRYFQDFTNITTKTRWALVESSIGECSAASGHLRDAKGYRAAMPNSPLKVQLGASIQHIEESVRDCDAG